MRLLPHAGVAFRRFAVDRHRGGQQRGAAPTASGPQPAAGARRRQQRVLPAAHAERALRVALSGDSLRQLVGFQFPRARGHHRVRAGRSRGADAARRAGRTCPPTELVEMAGFTGPRAPSGPDFDAVRRRAWDRRCRRRTRRGFRNGPIRAVVRAPLNIAPRAIARLFGKASRRPALPGRPRAVPMVARALAEFQVSLTSRRAHRSLRARPTSAMTTAQKRGCAALLRRARCVDVPRGGGPSRTRCSPTSANHVLAVPQLAPVFGAPVWIRFHGPPATCASTGPASTRTSAPSRSRATPADRYAFRTSPLRNVAVHPQFFHNGAFSTLEDAIRHHLDAVTSALLTIPWWRG